jgi:hypothetical protein
MKIIHSYVQEKDHVKGVHVLIGAFMETFWSAYFHLWNPEDKALVYWGTGEEEWESTTYGDAAKCTAAVALNPNAVGMQKCKCRYRYRAPTSYQDKLIYDSPRWQEEHLRDWSSY